jgi:ribonuclease-3
LDKAENWLEKTLQYRFNDVELFQLALTHRSARKQNNERLEFLGDAVLDVVVSEVVYRARPEASEGDLSKLRASLVKAASLARLALQLGLGDYLILGSGEKKSGGHRRESILADSMEALFGAVFLDGGIEAATTIINRVFHDRYETLPDEKDLRDPKTRLQEWLQARKMSLPEYELVDESGKDHKKQFSVACTVTEISAVTEGTSTTRRKAEQKAARAMLEKLAEKSE